jgi:cell division protein ZapA
MSAADRPPVRVTILNQQYSLRAPDDPRDVEEVAQSVDELLQAIAERAPSADSTRVAVLGCMHLADQLRTLERDLAMLRSRVNSKSEKLAELLGQLGSE